MKSAQASPVNSQEIYSGLIRIHILYHACQGPIFGLGMIEELGRHGYRLSAGTLYPLLHGLETKGYLRSREVRAGRSIRRVYRATAAGRKALALAKEKVKELVGELLEDESRPRAAHRSHSAPSPPRKRGSTGESRFRGIDTPWGGWVGR